MLIKYNNNLLNNRHNKDCLQFFLSNNNTEDTIVIVSLFKSIISQDQYAILSFCSYVGEKKHLFITVFGTDEMFHYYYKQIYWETKSQPKNLKNIINKLLKYFVGKFKC